MPRAHNFTQNVTFCMQSSEDKSSKQDMIVEILNERKIILLNKELTFNFSSFLLLF